MAFAAVSYPAIEAMRKHLGVPKKAVAERLNLSWESANKKLGGQVEFSITEAVALADWWDVSLDDLVGRTVPKGPVLRIVPGHAAQDDDWV